MIFNKFYIFIRSCFYMDYDEVLNEDLGSVVDSFGDCVSRMEDCRYCDFLGEKGLGGNDALAASFMRAFRFRMGPLSEVFENDLFGRVASLGLRAVELLDGRGEYSYYLNGLLVRFVSEGVYQRGHNPHSDVVDYFVRKYVWAPAIT